MKRRPPRSTRWATVIVIAATAAACVAEPRQLGDPGWPVTDGDVVATDEAAAHGGPPVLVVGDSITDSAAVPVAVELGRRGWAATVSAHPGDMVRDRLAPARAGAARHPVAVVINLGTNDGSCVLANIFGPEPCRIPSFSFADMRADADELVDLFAPGTCLVGIAPTFGEDIAVHWNELVRDGRLNAVRSWRTVTDAHPDYLVDALGHLTRAGQAAYGRFVAATVEDVCGTAG